VNRVSEVTWATLCVHATRALRRDARSPHLLVVATALVVAVAGMTAVATFTDRVQRALTAQASQLLAADRALTSSRELPATYPELARRLGLRLSEQLSMRSMVARNGDLHMVEIKAVTPTYPLRGEVRIAPEPFAPSVRQGGGPPTGKVWVDARLLHDLNARVGDSLRLGRTELGIDAVLVAEPDRAGDLFSIAPRVLMNLADVPATGLVLPGSRVQYGLLLAGTAPQLAAFDRAFEPPPDIRLVRPEEARPEVRSALEHAEQFLTLAALVATALAGLAILVAAQSFARDQVDAIAVLRTLGAARRDIAVRYVIELLLFGLIASALGALAGSALEWGLSWVLAGWLQGDLPSASWRPAALGITGGLCALLGFALPQILSLRDVPPARVLRRDLAWRAPRPLVLAAAGAAVLVLLAPWRAGDPSMTAWALGALGVCLATLLAASRLLLFALRPLQRGTGGWWRPGLLNLTRRPGLASLQLCALGLSLMAMLLLSLVRTDLVASWRTSLPPGAPDQFLINIQPEQVDELRAFLAARDIPIAGIYSMTRARLVSINDRAVVPEQYSDPRARRLADREFNLSAATVLKHDNRITAGRFWATDGRPDQFSFETEIAQTLGIKLGDHIVFRVADQTAAGEVTSLRDVDWETMEANFFVVSPPSLLAAYPATYITSFRLPEGRFDILRELAAEFPSVTVIDVKAVLQQVRTVMDKALAAIQFVFLFTLAAGVVVVFAAVQATQHERLHDATILKTLGATRQRIVTIAAVEFLTLGTLAGLIGGGAATGAAALLADRVLHVGFAFDAPAFALGIAAGITAVALAGVHAVRQAWRQPVAQILREWG
jgi:putative ABC transport system permease protein